MEIKNYFQNLKKKIKRQKKSRIKNIYQEIALEICREYNVDKKQYGMVFGFVKRLIGKGMWWKIKEVREQMQDKGISNIRYFMKSCKIKKNEQEKNNKRDSN